MNSISEDPEVIAQIARLYVEVTGELTQHSTEVLNDALQTYPPHWMIQVLNEAKDKKVHNWRYCEKALEARQNKTKVDPQKFTQGKYAGIVCQTGEDIKRIMAMRKR
jgi:hypothetical protein